MLRYGPGPPGGGEGLGLGPGPAQLGGEQSRGLAGGQGGPGRGDRQVSWHPMGRDLGGCHVRGGDSIL